MLDALPPSWIPYADNSTKWSPFVDFFSYAAVQEPILVKPARSNSTGNESYDVVTRSWVTMARDFVQYEKLDYAKAQDNLRDHIVRCLSHLSESTASSRLGTDLLSSFTFFSSAKPAEPMPSGTRVKTRLAGAGSRSTATLTRSSSCRRITTSTTRLASSCRHRPTPLSSGTRHSSRPGLVRLAERTLSPCPRRTHRQRSVRIAFFASDLTSSSMLMRSAMLPSHIRRRRLLVRLAHHLLDLVPRQTRPRDRRLVHPSARRGQPVE